MGSQFTYIIYDSLIYNIFVSLADFWLMLDDIKLGSALGFTLNFSLRDLILSGLLIYILALALARLFHNDFEED